MSNKEIETVLLEIITLATKGLAVIANETEERKKGLKVLQFKPKEKQQISLAMKERRI